MLRKRVVTVLTFNDGVLFRTKIFTPDYRYTANFVDAWSIDEIVLLDITRPERRNAELFFSVVSEFSKKCFVPLCVGGGVRSLGDFQHYLDLGADKISINTIAIEEPELVTRAAKRFGSQCVVVSIDVRKEGDTYLVYKNCGRDATQWRPESLARRVEELGAGEILLTSIDRDGSLEGYDNKLNHLVASSVTIPVIVCGGAGKWQDFVDGFQLGGADAVGTTNIYHFTETSIKSAKTYLLRQGLNVRA
jgi:imidazole glycerol-phosphate synthase subunit HisF